MPFHAALSRPFAQVASVARMLARARDRGALSGALLAAALAGVVVSQAGCVAAAATGLAVGAMSAHDRRSLGAQTDDQAIEVKAPQRLLQTIRNSSAVSVVSYNRRALIVGQVLDESERRVAEQSVAGIDNVRAVYNEATVGPGATVAKQAEDAYITTKVKASLIDVGGVQANHVKVVTENGVVFLLGLVTRRESDRAAAVASRVSGVRKVVTLFEFIGEEEAMRLSQPQPAPVTAPAARPLPASAPASTPGGSPAVMTAPIR